MSKELSLSISKFFRFCYLKGIDDGVTHVYKNVFDPYEELASFLMNKPLDKVSEEERKVTKYLVWSAMYEKSEEDFLNENKDYLKTAHKLLEAIPRFESKFQ